MTICTASNPEVEQDRAEDLLDNWRKYGYVMFPQQRAIYHQLALRIAGLDVIEAGCGSGTGTAVLGQQAKSIVGTDKCQRNIDFAKCLYPWIDFAVWNIQKPAKLFHADVVVAIEVLEHVVNPVSALQNLLNVATKEVWFSTPNGRGKPRPPENPNHVQEFAVQEMFQMIRSVGGNVRITVHSWEDFSEVDCDTSIDPLVYRIQLQ